MRFLVSFVLVFSLFSLNLSAQQGDIVLKREGSCRNADADERADTLLVETTRQAKIALRLNQQSLKRLSDYGYEQAYINTAADVQKASVVALGASLGLTASLVPVATSSEVVGWSLFVKPLFKGYVWVPAVIQCSTTYSSTMTSLLGSLAAAGIVTAVEVQSAIPDHQAIINTESQPENRMMKLDIGNIDDFSAYIRDVMYAKLLANATEGMNLTTEYENDSWKWVKLGSAERNYIAKVIQNQKERVEITSQLLEIELELMRMAQALCEDRGKSFIVSLPRE